MRSVENRVRVCNPHEHRRLDDIPDSAAQVGDANCANARPFDERRWTNATVRAHMERHRHGINADAAEVRDQHADQTQNKRAALAEARRAVEAGKRRRGVR